MLGFSKLCACKDDVARGVLGAFGRASGYIGNSGCHRQRCRRWQVIALQGCCDAADAHGCSRPWVCGPGGLVAAEVKVFAGCLPCWRGEDANAPTAIAERCERGADLHAIVSFCGVSGLQCVCEAASLGS